jgi:hypothetical protein
MAGVVERSADVAGLMPYLDRRIGDESWNDRYEHRVARLDKRIGLSFATMLLPVIVTLPAWPVLNGFGDGVALPIDKPDTTVIGILVGAAETLCQQT